jgi:hypothetical protein
MQKGMSALPPIADSRFPSGDVCFWLTRLGALQSITFWILIAHQSHVRGALSHFGFW